MYFVGREREIKTIVRSLGKGMNVIVAGKYGMGRTSLVKHISAVMKDGWQFVFLDFSRTPGQMTRQLLKVLLPENRKIREQSARYKSGRNLIVTKELKDKRKPVLVFDNVAKLTSQKLRFIRYLIQESEFQYVAVVESFLAREELFRLRAILLPAEMIILPYLNAESTTALICHLADKHEIKWSEQHLQMLVSATRGYPLGVQEAVKRELDLRKKNGHGSK